MTALQIFGAIFIIALVSGWVILVNAYRNEKEEPEEETSKDCGGYWN